MPIYAYKGMNAAGKGVKGQLDAESLKSARSKLRKDGIFPTEIDESGGTESTQENVSPLQRKFQFQFTTHIPAMDIALATRQLSTLVGAGIPLVQSLGALAEQVEHKRLQSIIINVRDRVNEGVNFADALAQTGAFSTLYVSMVRAGESGGALEQVLLRLAEYLESQVRLQNKVGSILIYPTVMFGFALVVVGILVTVVLPQITELLVSLGQELPLTTRIIIATSNFARHWWWAILLVAFAAVTLLRAASQKPEGRRAFDAVKLRLPVFGKVVRILAISRFTRTLSTLLAGGVTIVKALDIAKHVANNVILGDAIEKSRDAIIEGKSLAQPLRASGEFPALVLHMVEVGERSGELEAMLAKVADTYDEQVETSVTRMTALLEPLLILLMVGIVIVIILATLVPLLQITSSIGS